MSDLTKRLTDDDVLTALSDTHIQLAGLDLPDGVARTSTAKNYDSAIRQLGEHLKENGYQFPTRTALESWRDKLLADGYAVTTVNARLSAVRKLLMNTADSLSDFEATMILRNWANVESAKAVKVQDKVEADYGKRLTLEAVKKLIDTIDTAHLKGIRDRALIALGVGAGLRVSEIAKLTVNDVFFTENEIGERGIKVRNSKHYKTRIVVVDGWNSWVIDATRKYANEIALDTNIPSDERIFRGIKRIKGGWKSSGSKISSRQIQANVAATTENTAEYQGEETNISFHDLRRTYAKLSKSAGMSWEALRAQMGHSSVRTTEEYVGKEVDWSERVPNWSISI